MYYLSYAIPERASQPHDIQIPEDPLPDLETLKPVTGVAIRTMLFPAQTVVSRHIFKLEPLQTAASEVGAKPFQGVTAMVSSCTTSYFAFFLTKEALEAKFNPKQDGPAPLINLGASLFSSVASAPLETIMLRKRLGVDKGSMAQIVMRHGVTKLYQGFGYSLSRGLMSFGVGLSIGDMIQAQMGADSKDSPIVGVASKTIGWTSASLIGAPIFRIQGLLRSDDTVHSGKEALQKLEILPKTGSKCQKILHVLKKSPKLWRGSLAATPLIIIAGVAVSTIDEISKKH